jgi:hypothetical protein
VPWHVVQNHSECSDGKPWAVVKDSDSSVAGCHASKSDADKQVAALYANEPEDSSSASTTITNEVNVTSATDATDIAYATKVPTDSPEASGDDGNKAPPFKPKGSESDADTFAPKPASKPAPDECPDGQRRLPTGDCVSDEEYAVMSAWHGVLCVEGITTGDGREFAPDALTWAENALLRWQKESAHGGEHDVTVSVGRIDEVYRDGEKVMGSGVLDLQSPDGWEIYRRMKDGFAGGISIDADDISDADVEFVWKDEPDGTDEDDPLKLLFSAPEKMVFHSGRVRAATLVDIPAFVEARIQLGVPDGETVTASATSRPTTVTAAHETATSDEAWDSDAVARNLPNILPIETARAAYAYVQGDDDATRVAKPTCGYLHHEVDESGDVGAANLTACSAAIATLRLDDTLSDDERKMIYVHLAAHLRDAEREAPPLEQRDAVAAAIVLDDWRPDAAWFTDPALSVPTGITVTDEGRVYGHAAQWGECHIGFADECVTLPHEEMHPYFMTGEVICADGSRVAVGQITVGTGHAPMSYRASRAAEHYDDTGTAVADVAVGNDRFGVWVAGAVRASVAASRVHELRASGRVSGDWRRIGGQLRLVGLLAVNVPGFPIQAPRARIASGAAQALVAAGRTTVGSGPDVAPSEDQLNQLAMRRVMGLLMRRVRPTVEEVSR